MKTLFEVDGILQDAQYQARAAQKAKTVEAARERARGAVTLIKKARTALDEIARESATGTAAARDADSTDRR